MKQQIVRHTKRNLFAGVLNQGINILFPFLNRTLFLWLLGPGYLGLNGLFRSVLGFLSLSELGFETALVSMMYKPAAKGDRATINAYLSFYRTVYRWIGTSVFVVGLLLLPFIRGLVHGDVPPDLDLHVLYLAHLFNSAVTYFLYAYRGPILKVYNRVDVSFHIQSVIKVLQYVSVFLVLLLMRNYYAYVGVTIFFSMAGNLLILRETRRLFPEARPQGSLDPVLRRQAFSHVKSVILHKVGGLVSNASDNLVISAFLGLGAVAAYGNYYYLVSTVVALCCLVTYSVKSGFGKTANTLPRDEVFGQFMRLDRLMMAVGAWCFAMLAALLQPFVAVWTHSHPEMLRHVLTPILMIVFFFVNISRQPLLMLKGVATIWKQDHWKPLVGGIANLALNISFVLFLPEEYKLDGVILSTILAYVFIVVPWETRVFFDAFFDRARERAYWRSRLSFACRACILAALAWGAGRAAVAADLPSLVLRACGHSGAGTLSDVGRLFADLSIRGVAALLAATAAFAVLCRGEFADILSILRTKKAAAQ